MTLKYSKKGELKTGNLSPQIPYAKEVKTQK